MSKNQMSFRGANLGRRRLDDPVVDLLVIAHGLAADLLADTWAYFLVKHNSLAAKCKRKQKHGSLLYCGTLGSSDRAPDTALIKIADWLGLNRRGDKRVFCLQQGDPRAA
jgi:hypothetical protein